jgi:ATP-dependent 26S proteasome regulatory subunit
MKNISIIITYFFLANVLLSCDDNANENDNKYITEEHFNKEIEILKNNFNREIHKNYLEIATEIKMIGNHLQKNINTIDINISKNDNNGSSNSNFFSIYRMVSLGIITASFLGRNALGYIGQELGRYLYTNLLTNQINYPLFIRKSLFNKFFNKKKSRKIMFSDIGGYKEIKEAISEVLSEVKNVNNKETNIQGIILWGPPGNGKTILAEAIANESGYSFAIIDSTDIHASALLGDAEIQLKKILMEAKDNKPSIIFIDEIENLISNRNEEKSSLKSSFNSLKNILLTYMDGSKENMNQVILIGATNSIDDIDPAFMRAGRFEYIFKIDFPSYEDRLEIIEIILKKNNLSLSSNITLEYLSEITSDFSGADINKLFKIIVKINKKTNNNHIDIDTFNKAYLETTLNKNTSYKKK